MKYTARRMASRLASSPKWQAVPGGLLALRALRDASGAAFPLRKPDKVYGKIGTLEVRLTRRRRDIKLAQRLRYKVFYEEMSAVPTLRAELRRRDEDPYDAVCDHLLVIDEAASSGERSRGAACAARRSSAPTASCARRSPNGRSASTRRANTTSRRWSPPSRGIASWSSAARACWSRTATSGPSSCCGTACGPMCASTRST